MDGEYRHNEGEDFTNRPESRKPAGVGMLTAGEFIVKMTLIVRDLMQEIPVCAKWDSGRKPLATMP